MRFRERHDLHSSIVIDGFSEAAVWLGFLATLTWATPLQPSYSSCLTSYTPRSSGADLVDITNVFANLVSAAEASKLGLTGSGHDVLRVDLIGSTGNQISGYDETTNKLGG
jgi:hypothetical protein